MTANYLVWLFVKPSQLILLAALVAVVCRRRPLGRRMALGAASLVVLFGLVPLGAWLMRPLETRFEAPSVVTGVAGVVVLAGAERVRSSELHADPQLNSMGTRLTTFLLLAARYPQARLVHTGSAPESRVARSLIVGAGVAPDRVVFEDRSSSTCDSAEETRALVIPQAGERWLLVTSAFHMPRAVACFRAAGWDVIPYPTDFRRGPSPWSFEFAANLADLDFAAHEWLGLVYYRMRGQTNELFPAPQRL